MQHEYNSARVCVVQALRLVTKVLRSSVRYLPLPVLGRAVGITGEDFEVAMKAWTVVNEAGQEEDEEPSVLSPT